MKYERFYLPSQAPNYCIGCKKCFLEGEHLCPNPRLFTKTVAIFQVAKMMQKNLQKKGGDSLDLRYWQEQGWV